MRILNSKRKLMFMADNFFKMLKLFLFVQKSNLKTAFLSKGDALANVIMMTINNLSFIFMWWVIFQNKGTINGWNFGDMALLFAVMNNAFATFALFARGVQQLPEFIDNGNLDNFLVSPRSSLFMVSISESTFANWGDYVTGFLMFFISGHVTFTNFWLFILASLFAFIIMYSLRVILSALAFFASDTQRLGDNIFMAFLTFGSQPASIFTGWYKVVFLTIIPAGFLSLYPVEFIKGHSLQALLIMGIGSIIFFLLAVKIYQQGLKHYSSGNRFGVR